MKYFFFNKKVNRIVKNLGSLYSRYDFEQLRVNPFSQNEDDGKMGAREHRVVFGIGSTSGLGRLSRVAGYRFDGLQSTNCEFVAKPARS